MKYSVKVPINRDKKLVTSLFIDKARMGQWEKGLERIESIEGDLFETGSSGYLVFRLGDSELHLKVTVEKNNLPGSIIQIYEMGGAINRCINTFRKQGDQTIWTMDVSFEFDIAPQLPQARFEEKTRMGMIMFKAFVEGFEA
ncbi:MAG: SRPBCC family protein [Acholeplasmataceae bacterium]|nr:MAG: SRPBCC family protein [Acholeplasmataceae bacterium]